MPRQTNPFMPAVNAYIQGRQMSFEQDALQRRAELEMQRMALEKSLKELELGEQAQRQQEEHRARMDELKEQGRRQMELETYRRGEEMKQLQYQHPTSLLDAMTQYYQNMGRAAIMKPERQPSFQEKMALEELQSLTRIITDPFANLKQKEAAVERMTELRRFAGGQGQYQQPVSEDLYKKMADMLNYFTALKQWEGKGFMGIGKGPKPIPPQWIDELLKETTQKKVVE